MGIKETLPQQVITAAAMARSAYWRVFKPLTFGAAVAVTDEACKRIALVKTKTNPARKDEWQLPGGGIDRVDWKVARERVESGQYADTLPPHLFEPSARREALEEIGVDTEGFPLIHLLNYESNRTGNRDTLAIFHFMLPEIKVVEFRPEPSEIAEIRIWDLDALPTVGASYLAELANTLREKR